VETDAKGGREDMLAPERDPRRDIEGAGCGVALLPFRNETTEDARESEGPIEEVRWVTALSSVGSGGSIHPNKAVRAAISGGST
jgi:hypothetical protein